MDRPVDPPWASTGSRRLRPPRGATAAELATWRTGARRRLIELLTIDENRRDGELIMPDSASDQSMIMLRTDDADIPCWLLRPPPDRRTGAAVVAIAGHGRGIDDLVERSPAADDFHGGLAHKLVAAGFTVLCPEMISFGRRRTPAPASEQAPADQPGCSCQVDAMRGLLTAHPVLGRRVTDTLASVRALRRLDGIDPSEITIVGGSGGGAVALFTAALDDQLPTAVVGTYFGSFAASLGSVPHCICNAVPGLLTDFEMADVAALIAPRRMIIEAGRRDPIFPIAAAESAYAELVDVWRAYGAPPPDLVITDAGHQFVADDSIALLREHVGTQRSRHLA